MDIPEDFIQADMEGEMLHMKMEGRMVDMLENIDPKLYRKYITIEKGRPVFYMDLKKSLYVTL